MSKLLSLSISLVILIHLYYRLGIVAFIFAVLIFTTFFYKTYKNFKAHIIYILVIISLILHTGKDYNPGQRLMIEAEVTKAYDHYPNYQRIEVKDSKTSSKFSIQTKAKEPREEYDKVIGNIEIIPFKSFRNFNMQATEDYYFRSYIDSPAKELELEYHRTSSFLKSLKINLTNKIQDSIDKNFSNQNKDIISRLILGKTMDNEELTSAYSDAGLAHILAISGLHISILVMFLERLLNLFRIRYEIRHAIAGLVLVLYAFILGFPPSVMRALFMYFIRLISEYFMLNLSYKDILWISFIGLLLVSPRYIYDLGFQLSYGAVIGLAYFLEDNSRTSSSSLDRAMSGYFAANIVIFPILAYNFNNFNLISLITNLILMPIFSIVLITTIIGILIDIIFTSIGPIFALSNFLLDFSNFYIFNLLDKLSLEFRVFGPSVAFILLYYLILILAKTRVFDEFIYTNRLSLIGLCLVIIGFNPGLFVDDNLYLGFYDVGQGDSSYIYHKGTYIQIDTGGSAFSSLNPGEIVTTRAIQQRGLNIDALIISHFDMDHMGGLSSLLKEDLVKLVIGKNDKENVETIEEIKSVSKFYEPKEGDVLNLSNDLSLRFFNTENFDNSNDSSLIVLVEYKGKKILYTGDASSEIEDSYRHLGPIDILKVSHHGSDSSTSQEFISSMDPEYSVISVGENSYGHPSPRVVQTLEPSNVLRTDQEGEILFIINEDIDYISYNNYEPDLGQLGFHICIGAILALIYGKKEKSEIYRLS